MILCKLLQASWAQSRGSRPEAEAGVGQIHSPLGTRKGPLRK